MCPSGPTGRMLGPGVHPSCLHWQACPKRACTFNLPALKLCSCEPALYVSPACVHTHAHTHTQTHKCTHEHTRTHVQQVPLRWPVAGAQPHTAGLACPARRLGRGCHTGAHMPQPGRPAAGSTAARACTVAGGTCCALQPQGVACICASRLGLSARTGVCCVRREVERQGGGEWCERGSGCRLCERCTHIHH